jgi:cytochrome P450
VEALDDFSVTQPDVRREPWEYYARMRSEDPVHFDTAAHSWLVTRYEDVAELARMTGNGVISQEFGWDQMLVPWQHEVDEMMIREGFGIYRLSDNFKVDPPVHTFRRKLLQQALTPQRVAGLEGPISERVRDLIDKFIYRGEVEIVSEFTVPLSLSIIAELLNIPLDRMPDMYRWSNASVGFFDHAVQKEQHLIYARDIVDFQHFMVPELEKARASPGDDLISAMVHARDENGVGFTQRELLSISLGLMTAGNETTRNAMSFGIIVLAQQPQILAELQTAQNRDRAIQNFIEEVLRYQPPVAQLPRSALQDCEIGGQRIKNGDFILACWASANHDETKFPEPEAFRLQRANARQHMRFGSGITFCLGAALARLEMKCAFRAIVERLGDIRLQIPAAEVEIWCTSIFRGPLAVPVSFTRRDGSVSAKRVGNLNNGIS